MGARCRWRPEGAERNAIIFQPDGRVLRRGTLGDGIEHVLTTPSGKIWVGYFDEGVYGNYGWGQPGPEPIGASGLVRFNTELEAEWRFPFDGGLEPISDCYALNVDGETVWTSYYTDYPVVRIENETVSSWVGGTSARALVADETRLALIIGYANRRMLIGDHQQRHLEPYRLVLPDGRPLPRDARLIGRGAQLHALVDTDWYSLHLDDLQ